jgi:hypothetical protein
MLTVLAQDRRHRGLLHDRAGAPQQRAEKCANIAAIDSEGKQTCGY